MARQGLSEKTLRRYSRHTGLTIIDALARGNSGHWIAFVTADHRHGWVHAGTYEVEWEDPPDHWSDCGERWPGPDMIGESTP